MINPAFIQQFYSSMSEYKIQFDGVDTEMTWTTPSNNVEKAVIVMETNGYTDTGAVEGFLNVQGASIPYMLTGAVSGNVDNEVLTLYDQSSGVARTYTKDNIPSGLITLEIVWTGSKYKFVLDNSDMTMHVDNQDAPLLKWNCFGFRNTGNHADVDLHSLTLYDSNGKMHEWLCNDGSGATVKDSVGNNDATLSGGYSWVKL